MHVPDACVTKVCMLAQFVGRNGMNDADGYVRLGTSKNARAWVDDMGDLCKVLDEEIKKGCDARFYRGCTTSTYWEKR